VGVHFHKNGSHLHARTESADIGIRIFTIQLSLTGDGGREEEEEDSITAAIT